jgi:hypothetical protein
MPVRSWRTDSFLLLQKTAVSKYHIDCRRNFVSGLQARARTHTFLCWIHDFQNLPIQNNFRVKTSLGYNGL